MSLSHRQHMSKVNISQLNQLDIGYGVPWYNIEKKGTLPTQLTLLFHVLRQVLICIQRKTRRKEQTKALTVQVFQTPHLKVGQGYEWTGPA